MWLDLAIAMSCGGGGLVCGWIMHAIGGFGNHTLVKKAAATIATRDADDEPTRERISEVAERLQGYAVKMAADVDAHQTRVQAVNNSLSDDGNASPEAVFEAVNQLIAANEEMQSQLQSAQDRIHDQAVQIESAERRAQTDALTRVPNRGAFDQHLSKRHAMGVGKAGTLALLDVDHFKQFNDVYGHRAGDEVLRVVAKVMHSKLASYGLVARYGGEEFAVIMDGYSVQDAKDLIESARAAIGEREIQFEDKRLRVAASAGVAELMEDESIENWLQRADDAMYRSKEAGRNCGHWMDDLQPILIESQNEESDSDENVAAEAESGQEHTAESDADLQAGNETKVDPGSFAYLPDRKMLTEAFSQMQDKNQASSMYVMLVRRSGKASPAAMKSLLQIARATLRSVDRIGCEDDSTLLVCMPSIDESTAYERGQQICRSAKALQMAEGDEKESQVTVGLSQAAPGDDFATIVARVADLVSDDESLGKDPVRMHGQAAAV